MTAPELAAAGDGRRGRDPKYPSAQLAPGARRPERGGRNMLTYVVVGVLSALVGAAVMALVSVNRCDRCQGRP